jgi:DDE superfamily endonuclease/Helix-turn-helix of DDE superfamily endonuclease
MRRRKKQNKEGNEDMKLSYTELVKRPALLHRLSGLTVKEFETLLESFSAQYDQLVIQPRVSAPGRQRAVGGGQKGALPDAADKLLFILVYTRIYPLLFIQGMFFGIAESKACKWVGILLPVVQAALGQSHMRPKRAKGRSLEEIIEEFPELKELGVLTDGTERPIHRPKDEGEQKEHYSGKKKRHTSKHVTITHPKTQRILAVSEEAPGTMHDKKILDEEKLSCTTQLQVRADSGFQGLSIGHAEIIIPFKRKRKKKGEPKDELTEQQKEANTLLSKTRISIEHSNAGFKRNRSVTDILRNTRQGMSDSLALVAMGLHNLRVSMRVSYQY